MRRVDFKRGDKFPEPKNSEHKADLLAYFFAKVERIIHQENHPHKFRGYENVRDLLNKSTDRLALPIEFFYADGEWAVDCPDKYVKYLPQLIHDFKKLYRHQERQVECKKKNPKKLQGLKKLNE